MRSIQSLKNNLPPSVMIFGCGYVGTALAEELLGLGVRVGALTRNADRADELRRMGVAEVLKADLDGAEWAERLSGSYAAVVNCVSSAGGGIAGYRTSYLYGQQRILAWAQSQRLRSYVYTSSSSVYPQDDGAWIDETADTAGAPETGQVLLESEQLLAKHAHLFTAWYVLRLAGIYGPGRHFLLQQLKDGQGTVPGRGDYHMNMIHRDDITRALLAALTGQAPAGIYNICDDQPATKELVLRYLAAQLDLPLPTFDPAAISPRLQRRGGHMPDRRISNAKAQAQLDWQPVYPSYREGYAQLLRR